MTETAAAEKIVFLSKENLYVRFEVIGENVVVTQFENGAPVNTETVAKTGARRIYNMLTGKGYAASNETPVTAAAPVTPKFTRSTGPTAEDDRRRAAAEKIESERVARVREMGRVTCPKCRGTGHFAGDYRRKCWRCRGTGSVANDIRFHE